MKQLLIIRHAKSDWSNPKMADFDRPINARGQKNAPEMAKRLAKRMLLPQLIVSSPALRAISTAILFAEALKISQKNIQQKQKIYEASSNVLLEIITSFSNRYSFIALVGHNPGLTDLVLRLCECNIYNIPTCGNVLLKFPFDDWKMISGGTGDLVFYDYPKKEPVD